MNDTDLVVDWTPVINNLLNVVQVAILVALLRWVRRHNGDEERSSRHDDGAGEDHRPRRRV